MLNYWQGLQARERLIIALAGGVLLLLSLYLLVIEPWQQGTSRMQQSIVSQQETLAWMQQAAAEVQVLRDQGSQATGNGGQSLMGVIDASARRAGLSGAVRQLRPDPQGVTVRLENAGFDETLSWLGQLHREQGVVVATFTMERLPQPGRINASVSLSR